MSPKEEFKTFTRLEVTSVEDGIGRRKHESQLFLANFEARKIVLRASLEQRPHTTTEQLNSILYLGS